MRSVIGLMGWAQSGKDSAAAGLDDRFWKRVSFADGLREFALAVDPIINSGWLHWRLSDAVKDRGWEGAKQEPEVRRLLQAIGTEAGRNIIGEDVWTNIGAEKALDAMEDGYGVVFTDCRFANEVDLVRELGGSLVRITRPGVGPVNGHISETALDGIEPDFTIVNDGTPEELQEKLVEYARSLEKVNA